MIICTKLRRAENNLSVVSPSAVFAQAGEPVINIQMTPTRKIGLESL